MRRCSAQCSRIPTLRTTRDAARNPPIAPSSARFASATRRGSCSLPVGAGPPCHRKQGHKSKEADPTVIDSKAPFEPSECLHMLMSAVIQLHSCGGILASSPAWVGGLPPVHSVDQSSMPLCVGEEQAGTRGRHSAGVQRLQTQVGERRMVSRGLRRTMAKQSQQDGFDCFKCAANH